jgi:hypothetical protein
MYNQFAYELGKIAREMTEKEMQRIDLDTSGKLQPRTPGDAMEELRQLKEEQRKETMRQQRSMLTKIRNFLKTHKRKLGLGAAGGAIALTGYGILKHYLRNRKQKRV